MASNPSALGWLISGWNDSQICRLLKRYRIAAILLELFEMLQKTELSLELKEQILDFLDRVAVYASDSLLDTMETLKEDIETGAIWKLMEKTDPSSPFPGPQSSF